MSTNVRRWAGRYYRWVYLNPEKARIVSGICWVAALAIFLA